MIPTWLVLDFDGTVTQTEKITSAFLKTYRARLAEATRTPGLARAWPDVEAYVRAESPRMGWKFGGWEAAPAAADPYILASTTAELVLERAGMLQTWRGLPSALYTEAYAEHEAKFRSSVKDVIDAYLDRGVQVCFISNAGSEKLNARLAHELGRKRFARVRVIGDAGKFLVRPPPASTAGTPARAAFDSLPLAAPVPGLARSVLLERGSYFGALSSLWGTEPDAPTRTLVCGDIYELDLALPAALGCSVHLVERAEPLPVYPYELDAMRALGERGGSGTFASLLDRLG